MVLSVCEDILYQPIDKLSSADRDILLGVLAQYSMMKRQYAIQDRKAKEQDRHER
jgi:hypothetical protein